VIQSCSCCHTSYPYVPIMHEIDCTQNTLICAGADLSSHWPLRTQSDVKLLEKKEVYCSWFQLNGGGTDTQFPALRCGSVYYSMPLRIQKSIFRHMRLSASFINLELTANGVEKLRIPTTLLKEKCRTARRFMVTLPAPPLLELVAVCACPVCTLVGLRVSCIY
jgi:hypothetical protein